jgi:hypothetical protein
MKKVPGDLLIIATFFVFLIAFSSTGLANVPPRWYVAVSDNHNAFSYRSVKGNQTTLQFGVIVGESSFVSLRQLNGDWMQVGYVKGTVPLNNTDGLHGTTWLGTAYYYCDHTANGAYIFSYFTQAPEGTQENHEYIVWLIHLVTGYNSMFAFVDAIKLQVNVTAYTFDFCQATGQTETHSNLDIMHSHHFNMKAGPLWLNPVAFHDDGVHVDSPYTLTPANPTTEWWANGHA